MSWVPRIYAAIRRDFLPPFTNQQETITNWHIPQPL
jgi:hypothetical protein